MAESLPVRFAGPATFAAASVRGAASASSPGFTTQAFPAPLQVDGGRVPSSLLLQLDVERYDLAWEAFAARPLDPSELVFHDFMAALRAADPLRLAPLRRGDGKAALQRIIAEFALGPAPSAGPRVVARVGVGDGQQFVWERPCAGDPARFAFSVRDVATGSPSVEVAGPARPLEALILDLFRQQLRRAAAYAPVLPHGRYRYVFPLGPGRTSGDRPVVMLFGGEPVNALIPQPMGARPSLLAPGAAAVVALSVMQSARGALARRDVDRYWSAYTDESRDRLRAWIETLPPAEFDAFAASATRPRHVRFLLDADPVGMLFYTWPGAPDLGYESVVRTAAGTKLTNAYHEGPLDGVLRDSALFPSDFGAFRGALAATSQR